MGLQKTLMLQKQVSSSVDWPVRSCVSKEMIDLFQFLFQKRHHVAPCCPLEEMIDLFSVSFPINYLLKLGGSCDQGCLTDLAVVSTKPFSLVLSHVSALQIPFRSLEILFRSLRPFWTLHCNTFQDTTSVDNFSDNNLVLFPSAGRE